MSKRQPVAGAQRMAPRPWCRPIGRTCFSVKRALTLACDHSGLSYPLDRLTYWLVAGPNLMAIRRRAVRLNMLRRSLLDLAQLVTMTIFLTLNFSMSISAVTLRLDRLLSS